MTIFDLQNQIKENQISSSLIIFVETKDNFISNQYITRIATLTNKEIQYVGLNDLGYANDMFGVDNTLKVVHIDTLSVNTDFLKNQKDLYIVCNLVDKKTKELYNDYIIDIPVLTKDNITEYVYSKLSNVDKSDIDWLLNICQYNINRLQKEVDKILLFKSEQQKQIFKQFKKDLIFDDLSEYGVFDIVNAVVRKDVNKLKPALKDIHKIDANEMGFLTLLFNNFLNVIKVQLSNGQCSPESLGLSDKQFNAIRYSCGKYDKTQLLNIFELLSGIDKRIKTGELPITILIDYLIVEILNK